MPANTPTDPTRAPLGGIRVLDLSTIGTLVMTSYLVKVGVAIGLTPLIYAGHALLERWLKLHPVQLDADPNAT